MKKLNKNFATQFNTVESMRAQCNCACFCSTDCTTVFNYTGIAKTTCAVDSAVKVSDAN